MVRYAKEHKQETRQRIIATAGRRLKRDGIDGSGVATLMKDAGLTNGAFYAHFASKDSLVAIAIADQLRTLHANLVEQGGVGAAVAGVVAVLGGQVPAHDLFEAGRARLSLRDDVRVQCVQLVGDRGGDKAVLGFEVSVEGAVGQARVLHERRDTGAVDAVPLEPSTGGGNDPLPCLLLVFFRVPHHLFLSLSPGLRPEYGPGQGQCAARLVEQDPDAVLADLVVQRPGVALDRLLL